jgi:hypothetical protein
MMNKNPMIFLREATDFVERHGDLNWFNQAYVAAREYNNVVDSTEMALENQDLLVSFRVYLTKE